MENLAGFESNNPDIQVAKIKKPATTVFAPFSCSVGERALLSHLSLFTFIPTACKVIAMVTEFMFF